MNHLSRLGFVPNRFTQMDLCLRLNVQQQRNATLYAFAFLVPTSSGCVALNEPNS
jgi:hypothetical protein